MRLITELKITTLADNLVMTKCLGQWGLSFLLELVDRKGVPRKIMFDTGGHKKSLLQNIKQLKIELSDLDCIVISHGHGDHTAATVEIAEAAGSVKVYAHPHTFLPRFYVDKTGKRRKHGVPKGEGIEEIERVGGKVILNTRPTEIVPGVWTTGEIKRTTSFERAFSPSKGERGIIFVEGKEIDDDILDDQALWMDVEKVGPFVITGCAHSGPVNTIFDVRRIGQFEGVNGLVGGLHLVGRSEEYLQRTIESLKKFELSLISPCHCTGFKAMARLWQTFTKAFVLNFSGRVIKTKTKLKERVI